MRQSLAAFVMLVGTPSLAAAQAQTPTLPPIGLPLPPISAPLPLIGMEPSQINQEPTGPPRHDGRTQRHDQRGFHAAPIVYFVSPYAWGYEPTMKAPTPGVIVSDAPVPTAPVPAVQTGRLRLEVTPAEVQLYVDGEYVGTPQDVASELELQAGTRRLEIRAPGYETLSVDVKIVAQRTITYRGSLTADAAATPATPVARPEPTRSGTFYLIPGCYMGNVPPKDVKLPPGCDLSRMITHTPQ